MFRLWEGNHRKKIGELLNPPNALLSFEEVCSRTYKNWFTTSGKCAMEILKGDDYRGDISRYIEIKSKIHLVPQIATINISNEFTLGLWLDDYNVLIKF